MKNERRYKKANMNKLHLVLKKKWYDLIKSGEKKEEYRNLSSFYEVRIWANRFDIKTVVFHCGYTNITQEFEVNGIEIGVGKKEWGAEQDKEYYVLKLGNKIQ